jgi:hypothetical protein
VSRPPHFSTRLRGMVRGSENHEHGQSMIELTVKAAWVGSTCSVEFKPVWVGNRSLGLPFVCYGVSAWTCDGVPIMSLVCCAQARVERSGGKGKAWFRHHGSRARAGQYSERG